MYLQPVQPKNVTAFQFWESFFKAEENLHLKLFVRCTGFIPHSHNCMLIVFSGHLDKEDVRGKVLCGTGGIIAVLVKMGATGGGQGAVMCSQGHIPCCCVCAIKT